MIRRSVARAHIFGMLGLARTHPVQRTARARLLADQASEMVKEMEAR
jgi:hypothetical protein